MLKFFRPPALCRKVAGNTLYISISDGNLLRPVSNVGSLVVDARSASNFQDLDKLHNVVQSHLKSICAKPGGRIVVIGRSPATQPMPTTTANVSTDMTHAGLEGFVRSLAKECGSRQATCNLVSVAGESDGNHCPTPPTETPISFFLSENSAYITGQSIQVQAQAKVSSDHNNNESQNTHSDVRGLKIVVTGAARGIGAATALRLAQGGARLVLVDRPDDAKTLQKVADLCMYEYKKYESFLGSNNINMDKDKKEEDKDKVIVSTLCLDVTQSDAGLLLSDHLLKGGGDGGEPADAVVHNAGITRDKTLASMPVELWRQSSAVNAEAPLAIDAVLRESNVMSPGASIILLGSTSGIAGNFGQCNYATAKSGLMGFARAASIAFPSYRYNVVAPGFIETEMTAKMPKSTYFVASRMNNLSVAGEPIDVANAIAFLASKSASGVSGQVLRVCGGFMQGR